MTTGYWIEVAYRDTDEDEQGTVRAIGPFRSRASAETRAAILNRRFAGPLTAVDVETQTGLVTARADVRRFRSEAEVEVEVLEWLSGYAAEPDPERTT